MQKTTIYVKVRVEVEHPEELTPEDVAQGVLAECDYAFNHEDNKQNILIRGSEIVDHEIA